VLPTLSEFLQTDLAAILTATLCAITCAVLGTFLLLRRQALMGDAISHAVLPGLAAAFILSQTRDPFPMFLGAAAAGVLTAVLSDLVRRYARVEPGAAMGVVFSAMFALGVLLMSSPSMRLVDLDADCVLSGVLESITWLGDTRSGSQSPSTLASLFSPAVLAAAPRQLITAAAVALLCVFAIAALFKELRISSFDPALAHALGFKPGWLNTALMILVALACVAAFEAVGSILVVAMLVCPPAAARMLTDSLRAQLLLSALLAALAAVAGYFAAAFGPALLGWNMSVSAAGMISVFTGLILAAAILLAPRHGVLVRRLRRLALAIDIAREDLLAMLYRLHESRSANPLTITHARAALGGGPIAALALQSAQKRNHVSRSRSDLALTPQGHAIAQGLIRTHRLWELYLVEHLGHRPDHVHRTAMDLEHHTTPEIASILEASAPPTAGPAAPLDPHGKPIPRPPTA